MPIPARLRQEQGFTLLEVLVTCLILGILAAIAVTAFAGRSTSAMDADAKTNVRSLLSHVQTCYSATESYTLCDERSELSEARGVNWGNGPGQVEVRRGDPQTTADKVTLRAYSRGRSDGGVHTFTLVKAESGEETRSCDTNVDDTAGGCNGGSW